MNGGKPRRSLLSHPTRHAGSPIAALRDVTAVTQPLAPLSTHGFRFTRNSTYPNVLTDFEKSFSELNALPCDVLLTPHPEASDLWTRLKKRDHAGQADALVDATACRHLVDTARERLGVRGGRDDQRNIFEREPSSRPWGAEGRMGAERRR
jgi:hypothetical protein